MNKIEQLERLQRLLAAGTITKEEFENLKHQAIEEEAGSSVHIPPTANNEPPVLKHVVTTPNPEPRDPSHKIYGSNDFVPPARPQRMTARTAPSSAPANTTGKILGVLALVAIVGALAWWMFLKPTTNIQPAPTVAGQTNSSDKNYKTTSQQNTSADTEDPFDLNDMQVESANNTTFKTYRGDNVSEPIAYPTDIVKPKETAPVVTNPTGTTTSTTTKKKGDITTTMPTTTTMKKGQEFVSPSGDVRMEIGESEKGNVTIAGKYREELNTIGGNKNVTYKLLKNNFFVVTGFKGDNVYYKKTIEKDGKFKTFYTEYPKSKKAQIDPITVRMSRSFK